MTKFFITLLCCLTLTTLNAQNDIKYYRAKAKEAALFCKTKKLNTVFYILSDLSIHSGKNRFFIWDFKKDTIAHAFLVSHGCGSNPWGKTSSKEKAVTSNIDGTHSSSVGKFIIGSRSYSNWGIHVKYNLHGQETTNSNAFKRLIVLHSWDAVADQEPYPAGTLEGWGCPAISNNSMKLVDSLLKSSDKKVLLWTIQ